MLHLGAEPVVWTNDGCYVQALLSIYPDLSFTFYQEKQEEKEVLAVAIFVLILTPSATYIIAVEGIGTELEGEREWW